jgi:hypothetical protein
MLIALLLPQIYHWSGPVLTQISQCGLCPALRDRGWLDPPDSDYTHSVRFLPKIPATTQVVYEVRHPLLYKHISYVCLVMD